METKEFNELLDYEQELSDLMPEFRRRGSAPASYSKDFETVMNHMKRNNKTITETMKELSGTGIFGKTSFDKFVRKNPYCNIRYINLSKEIYENRGITIGRNAGRRNLK